MKIPKPGKQPVIIFIASLVITAVTLSLVLDHLQTQLLRVFRLE
jgi:hypothetical protein